MDCAGELSVPGRRAGLQLKKFGAARMGFQVVEDIAIGNFNLGQACRA